MVWIRFLAGTNSGCSFSVDSYHTSAFSNSSCEGQGDNCERGTATGLNIYWDFHPPPLSKSTSVLVTILQYVLDGSKSIAEENSEVCEETTTSSPTTTSQRELWQMNFTEVWPSNGRDCGSENYLPEQLLCARHWAPGLRMLPCSPHRKL